MNRCLLVNFKDLVPMLNINLDTNLLGFIVVAINSSAYLSEIFRAGIQSIPQGQYEAASSLESVTEDFSAEL